jgi:hypothetical protein
MKRTLLSLVIVCGLFLCLSPATEGFSINDTVFNDSDWEHIVIWDQTPGGGSFSAFQAESGGNPGYYQQGNHTYGPGNVRYGHVFVGTGAYDLSVMNPILSVDYSYDFIVFTAASTGSPAVGTELLVRQDGQYFVGPNTDFFYGDPWKSVSLTINVDDFRMITSSGYIDEQPDFSSNGGTIEFGYISANRTGFENNYHDFGIDNFEVSVNAVPIPAAVWLLSSGLIALLGFRKKFHGRNS